MIPLALFLVACAGIYFGTVATGFSVLMRLSLRLVAERKGPGDELGRFLDDPLLLFVPVRIWQAAVLVAFVVLLTGLLGAGSAHLVGLLVLSVAAFVMVCEHAIPLLVVRRDPEAVVDALLPSFTVCARLVEPLTVALVRWVAPGRRGATAPISADTQDEQEQATGAFLDAGEQEGLIEGEERKLLQSIVEFGGTLVREVMTPRPDIVAIRADSTVAELRTLLREQEYSRIPVFAGSLDNIAGLAVVKDLINLDAARDAQPVSSMMRPAFFVPETKRVSDLLKEFQRRHTQAAIVLDEYGGTAGLVTLEDLLEEIVGEIRDEYDEEAEPIAHEGDGAWVFSGKVNIDEAAERLAVTIAPEGFETVGGYLLARLGRVPAVGERFDIDGLSVEVLEAERRRVTKVRIRRLAADPDRNGVGTV